jgi:serine/threonine-protein kinase
LDGESERARKTLEAHPGDPELSWFFHDFYQRDWQGALQRLSSSEASSYPFNWFIGFLPRPLRECFCFHQMNGAERVRTFCEASRVLLEERLVSEPDNATLRGALGETYALLGRMDDAVREGRRAVNLRSISRHAVINARHLVQLARIYATVGDQEAALEQLDHLLSRPAPISVQMLRMDSVWDPLRDNPKFSQLLEKYEP